MIGGTEGMSWGMGFIGWPLSILVILAITALVKYLMPGRK
jgi:hypothetical protein